MSKFIGGGFPGIKECIDEKNIITKESREKREFSVRKIIPINQILAKNKISLFKQTPQEKLNLRETIIYNDEQDITKNTFNIIKSDQIQNINLNTINGPIVTTSKKLTSKRSIPKKSTSKKLTSKKSTSKKSTQKNQHK